MGWGYRKRKVFGTRYLHVSINATQKGPSSVGVKVGPFSWNTRTKAFRFDGPGGLYWQQRNGRQSRGKSTGGGPRGGPKGAPGEPRQQPIRGGPVGLGVRWVRRGGKWTATQAAERSAGYAERVTGPWQRWADDRREFGPVPIVRDLTTDETVAASDARALLVDERHRDENRRWQERRRDYHPALYAQMVRDEEQRIAHASRDLKLSWFERVAIRARGEDPDEWAAKWHATDVAVMNLQSQRLAAAGAAIPVVEAGLPARRIDRATAARNRREQHLARVIDLDAATGGTTQRKEPAVANAVRTFADLHDPDIDPKEFPEELPMHLGEVRNLIASRAEELQGEADRLRAEAEAMAAYADYMEAADADRDMVASLRESVDAMEAAAVSWAQAAEAVDSAGDGVAAAKGRAEAAYGDWDVPDFGRAG